MVAGSSKENVDGSEMPDRDDTDCKTCVCIGNVGHNVGDAVGMMDVEGVGMVVWMAVWMWRVRGMVHWIQECLLEGSILMERWYLDGPSRFCLPIGIHNCTILSTNVVVVPPPSFSENEGRE
mmetsp:Transcript_36513/g.53477  ORF Transcript_36513/g.53477 Transcript_36513/m.53477 type:complete len:122 (+) Transcript_36513:750-1115(+)